MSIDPMNDPNVSLPLALTRWITHFCAPVFVLLSGTSAGLMVARKSPAELAQIPADARPLADLRRDLHHLHGDHVLARRHRAVRRQDAGLHAGHLGHRRQHGGAGRTAVRSAARCVSRSAPLIVLGHNALDGHWPVSQGILDTSPPLWAALHVSMSKVAGPFHFLFLYPLLPWLGVMLLGFGASALFEREAGARNRALLWWGIGITAAFIVLRFIDGYGEPNHWQSQVRGAATLIDFLNTTKYPPSLLFLAMTLGPGGHLLRLRRSHARLPQGHVRDVRARAVRVLRGALLPAARAQPVVRRGAGHSGRTTADVPAVLSRRATAFRCQWCTPCGRWSSRCCIRSAAGWRPSRRAIARGGSATSSY